MKDGDAVTRMVTLKEQLEQALLKESRQWTKQLLSLRGKKPDHRESVMLLLSFSIMPGSSVRSMTQPLEHTIRIAPLWMAEGRWTQEEGLYNRNWPRPPAVCKVNV